MKKTKMLRELLNSGEAFLTAGANDALSAVIAERAGFKCVTMGGYLATAVTMARPDIGLLTLTEMSTQLRHICDVTNIPVIADGDVTGSVLLLGDEPVTEVQAKLVQAAASFLGKQMEI